MLSKVKAKYWDRIHKFSLRMPKYIQEAEIIDIENKKQLWREAIRKEMDNVRIEY